MSSSFAKNAIVLGLLSAIGPFAIDMYLPALPAIAVDLHASTYLMVGGRSRFENYGTDRTGCFWIGG